MDAVSAALAAGVGADIAHITSYVEVADVDNKYTLDMANKAYRNFKFELGNATAKEVDTDNMPTNCDFTIEITATAAPAITWFEGVVWNSGSAPTIEASKFYSVLMMKRGTAYYAAITEGWAVT
jgi:hypothetical protein